VPDDATTTIHAAMPLCAHLGVTTHEYTAQQVRLSIGWAPELCTTGGLLHGGVLMALADSAGAACAFLNLPDGAQGTSTIESKTNFLGSVTGGRVVATSRVLKAGRRVVVVETELRDERDRLVGKTVQSQIVL
jgi:1,4-dihydroxy-2-naphthoyl-CoA hydrolase